MSRNKLGRNPFLKNDRRSSVHNWEKADISTKIDEKKDLGKWQKIDIKIDLEALAKFLLRKFHWLCNK